MPELPDITVYLEALEQRILGAVLQSIRVGNPFLVRSVDPPLSACHGMKVERLKRLGKRICFEFSGDLWLVLHLMIAGRLHWKKPGTKLAGRNALAAFDFPDGTLTLTEGGTQRRASLYVVRDLATLDRGGIEVLECSLDDFAGVLTAENHTLKRSLTDPVNFSGIGNAYSDEILHRAGLSPIALTQKLKPDEIERLFFAVSVVLREWIVRLRDEAAGGFPEKVTAFRPEMAVHGRFGLPCPACGAKVQRIRYATNETNYCAKCQTGGRLLADRGMSRLLKQDWPRTLED